MKIALSQLNYHIGNFEYNYDKIVNSIQEAKRQNADIIVFSELAVCGYPPHDLLERQEFIEGCYKWLYKIKDKTDGIAVVIGCPSINPNKDGKKLFNSAFFISNKEIISVHHKALLPTYDIFDEYRYFEPCTDFHISEFMGLKIAITICEDLWDDQPLENEFGKGRMYTISPMEEIMKLKPDFIINVAASPFSTKKRVVRQEIFTGHAKRFNIPLIYVNQIGGNTELIFDGGSMIVNSIGNIISSLALFSEDFRLVDSDSIISLSEDYKQISEMSEIEKVHDALVLGIRDYFYKSGFKSATLGLSGGIDSAVVLVLAVKALGHENVRALLMPSVYSSDHSVSDAIKLAETLHVKYDIVPIQQSFESLLKTLHPLFENLHENVTEENIQARVRGLLLMALSNKFGHILLNTSNKSEIAVGYGTIYGDMCGGLSVIGDLYKTEVYHLSGFINKNKEIIPEHIIKKAPSAELRPGQKDSDSIPEYHELDKVLYQYIEMQKSPEEIVRAGLDKNMVEKAVRLININEYKRHQTPPILRVTSKAFGIGRKIPIVAKF